MHLLPEAGWCLGIRPAAGNRRTKWPRHRHDQQYSSKLSSRGDDDESLALDCVHAHHARRVMDQRRTASPRRARCPRDANTIRTSGMSAALNGNASTGRYCHERGSVLRLCTTRSVSWRLAVTRMSEAAADRVRSSGRSSIWSLRLTITQRQAGSTPPLLYALLVRAAKIDLLPAFTARRERDSFGRAAKFKKRDLRQPGRYCRGVSPLASTEYQLTIPRQGPRQVASERLKITA